MGLFSSLFGGGSKTTVTQYSANNTSVNLENEILNYIDLEALASAVSAMGLTVQGAIDATGQGVQSAITATSEQTQALISTLGTAQILTQAADAKARIEQNEILNRGFELAKISALAGGAYLIWRKL